MEISLIEVISGRREEASYNPFSTLVSPLTNYTFFLRVKRIKSTLLVVIWRMVISYIVSILYFGLCGLLLTFPSFTYRSAAHHFSTTKKQLSFPPLPLFRSLHLTSKGLFASWFLLIPRISKEHISN